jgi:SRSO17 transposase
MVSGGNPMTEQEIAGLGPAFSRYLSSYRPCFGQARTAAHFDTYCRGLLTDLPRKSVEPIALQSGTAVRTLQEFLVTSKWGHDLALDTLQRSTADELATIADELGTVGLIDETSCRKWGDQTPGVQRQYLGCVGKVDHGIVTVHVGVARGTYSALLAADLYLPKSWAADRERCRAAGIPDSLPFRPKWRIAALQWARLWQNGVRFDWLTFDEGYGASVPFLRLLGLAEQRFVAEVPVNFAVRDTPDGPSRRADERLHAADARSGSRYRVRHQTVADSVWRVSSAAVWVAGRRHALLVAINEATAEVKYFLTNATEVPVRVAMAVAFRRWRVEHGFRLAKQEAGLMDYEGRSYVGLVRHLTLSLIVLGFVAGHTERLRGEKPARDDGAGLPGPESPLRDAVPPTARRAGDPAYQSRHPLSPTAERPSHPITQKAAA